MRADPIRIFCGGDRGKHAAVMLLDCAKLPWKVEEIVAGLGTRYAYKTNAEAQARSAKRPWLGCGTTACAIAGGTARTSRASGP
jgi:hypothetical protein